MPRKRKSLALSILQHISRYGVSETARSLGVSRKTVSRYLRRMIEAGLVARIGYGAYALTDKGRKLVSLETIIEEIRACAKKYGFLPREAAIIICWDDAR